MSLRRAAGPFLRPGSTARRFGTYRGGVNKLSTNSQTQCSWKVERYSTIDLALITGGVAWSKNRSPPKWFVGTLFFGRLTPLMLIILPDLHDKGSSSKGIKGIDSKLQDEPYPEDKSGEIKGIDFKLQVEPYPEDKSGDKSNE